MPKITGKQTNFNGGEFSPEAQGRDELQAYTRALKYQYNSYSLKQGPAVKRPGTRFVAEVKDSSKATRLQDFTFNANQTYAIEFGDQYIRFCTNEAQLESGGSPYEISSPYLEADLFELKFVQSADILYIFHPDYSTRKLSRTGATSWTLTELDFIDGPYGDENTGTTTITPSATTGTITLTASAALWSADDVGRIVRLKHGSTWGSAKITGYTSTTVVDAEVQAERDFGGTGAVTAWRLGVFSTGLGWPVVGAFYQERLVIAKGVFIYASESANFETFSPTDTAGDVQDDSGFARPLTADQVNDIVWLRSAKVLSIGTRGSEWILRAGSLTNPEPITPTNIILTRETTFGSTENLQAIQPGISATLFVGTTQRILHEFVYDFNIDGYSAPEISVFAEHLVGRKIKEFAWAQKDGLLYLAMEDGTLVTLTYLKDQEVLGFAQHELGGTLTGSDNVEVESICSILSSDLSYNQVWVIVKRTINGSTKRYIEYFTRRFNRNEGDVQADARFMDSYLDYSGVATDTVSGLGHLEGETLDVLADGATHPQVTVSSGSVTLDNDYENIAVGLHYESQLDFLEPDLGGTTGTAKGKRKRITSALLNFYDTLGGKIGPDVDHLETLQFRESSDLMDSPPPLFTGNKSEAIEADYEQESTLVFVHDQPLPFTLRRITWEGNVHES